MAKYALEEYKKVTELFTMKPIDEEYEKKGLKILIEDELREKDLEIERLTIANEKLDKELLIRDWEILKREREMMILDREIMEQKKELAKREKEIMQKKSEFKNT